MYQLYLKIGKINEKVKTIFILLETLTFSFDVALNKRNASQGYVFCVWLFSCNDSVSLAIRKRFLRLNVIYRLQSVFADVDIGATKHNFNIALNFDNYNIMIVMQKLKFMQEFTFAINVKCLHSSLQAKLLMHNCACKTCINMFL